MEDEQEFQRSSKMADKSNILAGLAMATHQQQANKENQQHRKMISTDGTARPTGGAAGGRQHKLKQRFTVIRKLGKGTYGKVQLAINKETGQEVAIKTIKKTKIENEQDLQRVRREIQIMSSIEHPHIIHIYEVFENKDKIVLVMQYAPGGELYEYVSQSKVLDDSEARRLFRQIATAIYYCHQNKICHRDLKLENILLDEKNNAKLADFGLSNVFDKSRQLQTFCGSPLYASPEIVQGSPYEGPEVDCWSLGVLLYTLVYGAMPFDGSNFKRLVKQISEACYFEPKQRSQASPLIRRLLCADPLKRANVSDICADPWVNGQSIVPPGSPRNELPLQQQNQVYPSLVQVAQDMANLTPVRLDLLLALAPQLSPVIPGQKAESRPALAKRTDNAARRSPVHLEPALMELEEGRASSPVASYIVRNLDEQQAGDEPLEPAEEEMEVMDHMEEEEQSDRPQDRAESTELSVTAEPQQVQVSSEQVEPAEQQVVEHSMSISSCDANQSRPGDPPAAQEESEPVREVKQVSTAEIEPPIAMEVEERPELECQPPDSDKQVDQHSEKAAPQEVSEPVDEPTEATQAERAEPTPIDESSSLAANEPASGEAEAQQTEVDSEKPKKVKKKIVVVRKRKKVTKKEVGTDSETAETKDKSKSDKEEEAAPTADSASTEKPKATKPKGPGKVRIPNTFQAPVDGATAQTPVKQTPPEGRRQSVLVAEVSQKLLQQLQEQTSGSDQVPVQLPGARVSDKKSEFERRASLAVGVAAGGSPQSGVMVCQSGPIPAESLRESLSILDEILQTLVEPVEKQEPLEVSLLRPPENLSDGDPLTPTGDSPMHLANGEQSQLEQKLEEYADQNGSKRNDAPKSTATGDERSDSVETIKAEELVVEEPTKIRSSLLIDLAPRSVGDEMITTSARPSRDSAGSLGSQVAIGPAPITRSYKKVTFTRDGACITETGKIYATQRDDGSVRRVERKSKITHYPATGDGNQGSAQRIQEQEETEEEQVVFGGDDGERFWKESHHQRQQQQHSSFSSNSRQQVTGRPFEKLIMPSTGMLSDRDDDFRRHSLFSRQSGPLGRADSGSSCSSSSTDVFDDIFDTWTGAISMFNRNHQASGGSSRAGGLLSRAFEELASISPATSLFGGRKSSRHRGVSSSLAGTPRCESVEPPAQRGRDRADSASQRRWAGDATSGYESDSRERPASAMGNPRRERLFAPLRRPHLSDAEPLFPFGGSDERDPLSTSGFGSAFGRGDQLLRSIEQEQESLKQRLAREHRHIWKGSTPSLFQEDEQEVWQRDTRQQVFSQKQQYDGGRPRATTHVQATQGTAATEQVLNQSQSSSSFLRQSVALDSAPQRTRPGEGADNLPPQPVRKSLSKTSVITSKLANVQLTSGAEKQQQQQQSSASFIELKRTSSSSSNHRQLDNSQQLQHQQHQVQQQLVSTSSRLISTASGSSSAFWEGRITPLSSATSEALARQQPDTPKEHSPSVREQAEARVQDWLQESTGNMSSLSGSHSSASASASDSLNAGSRVDPFANLYGSLQSRREVAASLQSRQHSASLLPPIPGPVRSTSRGSHTSETTAAKQQVKSVVVSSSSTSRRSATVEGGANVEKQQQHERQHIIQREESGPDQVKQVSSSSSNKVTSTSFSLRLDSPNQSEMKQVLQKVSTTSTQSASVTGRNTEGLIWPRAEVAIDNSQMLSEEQDNSISGPGSAELDSTSSLLDQLRSRGYRSMINQRMVSQPPVEQQVSSTKAAVKTESCSRVVSSSTSSTVSGSTRLVQQKQVFTSNTLESTSSASNLDQQELPPESSSTANIVNTSAQKLEEPLAAAQVETIEQVADETKQSDDSTHSKQNKDVEEEEMDEDVREAKANIKGYLDSVKETENFLRSLQQEEEQLERHRQQLYLFNNLMLSSKLNGINRNGFNNGSGQTTSGLIDELNFAPSTTHNGGTLSAPVRSSYKLSFMAEPVTTNGFIPSAALSFEPTYTIPTSSAPSVAGQYIPRASQRPLEPLRFGNAVEHDSVTGTSTHTPSYLDWRTSSLYPATPSGTTSQVDPLERVQALNLQHRAPLAAGRPSFALVGSDRTNEARFRRSQSQLGDQFTDYKRRARPLSANLDSIGLDSNPYFPSSAKRASSQLRYSNNHHSSRYNPPAVSEYRSAYGGGLTTGESHLPSPRAVSPAGETLNVGTDDDDDDGMSAYRATNYVPRVVPLERGRAPARRSLSRQPEWQANDGSRPGYGRERRTSLQPPATTSTASEIVFSSNLLDAKRDVSPAPTTTRRSSLGEFTGSTPDAAGGNTRLSQLELRIEQNRKRREQLLSGRLSPQPQREDESKPEVQPQRSRELSPVQQRGSTSSSTGGLKLNRPSRLESMEARIKRRSYCVRMANRSPERSHLRSQQSLEKWRPSSTLTDSSSPKNPGATPESGSLFQISSDKKQSAAGSSTNGLDGLDQSTC